MLEDLKHLNVQLKDLLLDLDPELNLLVTESRFVTYESGLGIESRATGYVSATNASGSTEPGMGYGTISQSINGFGTERRNGTLTS